MSSKYHLCSKTASNATWLFALRVFLRPKAPSQAVKLNLHIELAGGFFTLSHTICSKSKVDHPRKIGVDQPKLLQELSRLTGAPCRKMIATLRTKCVHEVLYLGIAVVFWRFGVSASFGYDPPTRVKRINDFIGCIEDR